MKIRVPSFGFRVSSSINDRNGERREFRVSGFEFRVGDGKKTETGKRGAGETEKKTETGRRRGGETEKKDEFRVSGSEFRVPGFEFN